MSLIENKPLPRVLATAFGRVFYGAPNLVMFSQILFDDIGVVGKCYQKNDPTSSENPDIIATDGGEITIQDCGNIIALEEFATGLLIFAQNGIWFLSGPEGGFTALDYTLKKISTVRLLSYKGKVNIGSLILFATDLGIHSIGLNDYADVQEQLITEQNIDTYLKTFLTPSIRAHFDRDRKQVIWQNDRAYKFLIFDIRLNAWYPQELPSEDIQNKTVFSIRDQVYYVNQDISTRAFNISQRSSTDFTDYGVPFDSYMVTNYDTGGNFTRYKGIPILSAFFKKTEKNILSYDNDAYTFDYPSSCLVSVRWDWNVSNAGGKWTPEVQMYRPMPRRYIPTALPEEFDTGESVLSSKAKFRGNGRSIQIKFQSEGNKDMQVLGYAFEMTSKGRQ